jgi:hypothetical protein
MNDDRALASETVAVEKKAVMKVEQIPIKLRGYDGLRPWSR